MFSKKEFSYWLLLSRALDIFRKVLSQPNSTVLVSKISPTVLYSKMLAVRFLKISLIILTSHLMFIYGQNATKCATQLLNADACIKRVQESSDAQALAKRQEEIND